jgi:hypothetical protein
MLPLNLTYSLPLPLWHQEPKPKDPSVGRKQTSRVRRDAVKSQTGSHPHRTLNFDLSDPPELAEADPVTLK